MMTVSPITSDQKQQFDSILARAVKRARKEANPGRDGMQRLFARGGEFEDWFVAGFSRFTAKFPDYTLAKSVLGGDFISPEEVMVARPDVVYSPEQIAELVATIPSEEALRSLKENGYGLMPQPPQPRSLLKIHASKPSHFDDMWLVRMQIGGQAFIKNDLTGAGWLAIRKTRVANSTDKNWEEQNTLLSSVEYVPNAAEASWFITIFFDVRGVRLFENVFIRTNSLDSNGIHVRFGFGGGILQFPGKWDSYLHGLIGLVSAWKF